MTTTTPLCPHCKIHLMLGKALQNTVSDSPDFPGDTGAEVGCTRSYSGPPKLVDVFKCPKCGYSRTTTKD